VWHSHHLSVDKWWPIQFEQVNSSSLYLLYFGWCLVSTMNTRICENYRTSLCANEIVWKYAPRIIFSHSVITTRISHNYSLSSSTITTAFGLAHHMWSDGFMVLPMRNCVEWFLSEIILFESRLACQEVIPSSCCGCWHWRAYNVMLTPFDVVPLSQRRQRANSKSRGLWCVSSLFRG